jgi:hypothetical protein
MHFIIILSYFILSSLLHCSLYRLSLYFLLLLPVLVCWLLANPKWPWPAHPLSGLQFPTMPALIYFLGLEDESWFQTQLGLMRQTQLLSHQLASPGCVRKWSQNLPLGK